MPIKIRNRFQINQFSANIQQTTNRHTQANLGNGTSVLVYANNNTPTSWDIYGRIFNLDGTSSGNEFRINQNVTGSQIDPVVTNLGNNDFATFWFGPTDSSNSNILGRVYRSLTQTFENEFVVNTVPDSGQHGYPDVVKLNNGNYLVTWDKNSTTTDNFDIWMAQLNSTMNLVPGTEVRVNSYAPGRQRFPHVASLTNGNFIITWEDQSGRDGGAEGVYARPFYQNGTAITDDVRINTFVNGSQTRQSIANLIDNRAIVTWVSQNQKNDGTSDVYGAILDSQANKANGADIPVNIYSVGDQWASSVTGLDDGSFVVGWSSTGSTQNGCYYAHFTVNGASFSTVVNETLSQSFSGQDCINSGIYQLSDKTLLHVFQNGDDSFGQRYTASAIVTNTSQTITYKLDSFVATDLNPIIITSPAELPADVIVQATISLPSETGQIVSKASNAALIGFDQTLSQWKASGTLTQVNTLLTELQYEAVPEYFSQFRAPLKITFSSGGNTLEYNNQLTIQHEHENIIGDPVSLSDTVLVYQSIQHQYPRSIVSFNDGSYAIVYLDGGTNDINDGNQFYVTSIHVKKFSSNGVTLIGDTQVDSFDRVYGSDGYKISPVLIARDDGGFYVFWSAKNVKGDYDIYYSRYSATGSAIVQKNTVNVDFSITSADQTYVNACKLSTRDIVIIWQTRDSANTNYELRGRMYHEDIGPVNNNEFAVSSDSSRDQVQPKIEKLAGNKFVVAWGDNRTNLSVSKIYARVFSTTQGNVQAISDDYDLSILANDGSLTNPVLTSFSNNRIFAAWYNPRAEVYGQLAALTNTDSIATCKIVDGLQHISNQQFYTGAGDQSIGKLLDGGSLITFAYITPSNLRIFAQPQNAKGQMILKQFRVDQEDLGVQARPFSTYLSDNSLVATWQAINKTAGRVDWDVVMRRFAGRMIFDGIQQVNVQNATAITELQPISIKLPVLPANVKVNATISLSDKLAGQINSKNTNSALLGFDTTSGQWRASGNLNDVNELLRNLTFTPDASYSGSVHTRVHVQTIQNNKITDGRVETFTLRTSSNNSGGSSTNNAITIGAAVAAFGVVALIALAIYYVWRRRRQEMPDRRTEAGPYIALMPLTNSSQRVASEYDDADGEVAPSTKIPHEMTTFLSITEDNALRALTNNMQNILERGLYAYIPDLGSGSQSNRIDDITSLINDWLALEREKEETNSTDKIRHDIGNKMAGIQIEIQELKKLIESQAHYYSFFYTKYESQKEMLQRKIASQLDALNLLGQTVHEVKIKLRDDQTVQYNPHR